MPEDAAGDAERAGSGLLILSGVEPADPSQSVTWAGRLIRRRSDHWALVADKAPRPFRAAIHSGKVPPRWGAMLAS